MALTETPQDCDKRGNELTLYYNVGDDATQVWVEHLGMIDDLTMSEVEDENEQTTRRSTRSVKEYNQGDIDLNITGTQLTDTNYEGWAFLNSLRRGGNPGDIMVLTGLITEVGSYGWRGMFRNFDRTISGPATGNMTSAVNLKPAACADVPVRVVKIAVSDTVADFDPTVFESVNPSAI